MTADYLATALAFTSNREESEESAEGVEQEPLSQRAKSGRSAKSFPPSDLNSPSSLSSRQQVPGERQCMTCGGPLATGRIAHCRPCTAALLRRMNPDLADEIYGATP